MRGTRYDINQFHRHMEYDNNTLIYAPRQSGKTCALVRKFVEESNSVLLFTHHRRYIDQMLMDLGRSDKLRDVYRMSGSTLRGRRATTIYIDEIDIYDGSLQDVWLGLYPSDVKRIVAVTSPSGRRSVRQYEELFPNMFNMANDQWMRRVAERRVVTEHFDKELFRI